MRESLVVVIVGVQDRKRGGETCNGDIWPL